MTGQEVLGKKRIMETNIMDAIVTAIKDFTNETTYRVSDVRVSMYHHVTPHGVDILVNNVECEVQLPIKWSGKEKGK